MAERVLSGHLRAIGGCLALTLTASYNQPSQPIFGCTLSWHSIQPRAPTLSLSLHGIVWILNDDSSITIVVDDERPKRGGPSCQMN